MTLGGRLIDELLSRITGLFDPGTILSAFAKQKILGLLSQVGSETKNGVRIARSDSQTVMAEGASSLHAQHLPWNGRHRTGVTNADPDVSLPGR